MNPGIIREQSGRHPKENMQYRNRHTTLEFKHGRLLDQQHHVHRARAAISQDMQSKKHVQHVLRLRGSF